MQAFAIAWSGFCLFVCFVLLGDLTAQLFRSMQWAGLSHLLYSRGPGCSSPMNLPAGVMPSPDREGMSSRGADFNSHNPVFPERLVLLFKLWFLPFAWRNSKVFWSV